LPDCGVVSALSGSGREAGREIQRRGGVYLCDRGSTHIRWQERLLAAEYDRLGLPFEQLDPRPFENEEIEYAMADAITLPSQFTRQSFIAMGVPAAKLKVVPYGVNLAAFHRVAPRSERFRILFVGQLCVRKGLHDLLDCFADLALSDAELVLVGGHTADTEALLRRARLDNVRLTGLLSRAAVAVEMSRATVMVLPSLEEGLALVMAQALACGCPVIASTHTGAEDLFDDGVEGFIIPPSDQEALAGRILQFYRDRTLAPAMGEKAVARMAAMGGFERYGRASLALFDELLRAKGIPVSAG
jgi:glycosyltransferase involved in cell wall biosynthesis